MSANGTNPGIQIIPWVIDADMIREGGRAGGAYLEQIGITDLAVMSREQYQIFCARVIANALPDAGISPAHPDLAPF